MSNLTDADREALGRIIWETSRADESTISYAGANIVADAVLVSDWFQGRVAEARADERERDALRDERNHWIGEAKKYERLWKWADENGARWLRERNEAREALARVEALADELEAAEVADLRDHHAGDIRAALRGE